MATVIGEAIGLAGRKQALLLEALQQALENAGPPSAHFDVQAFRVVSIELQHGGYTGTTKTRVTLDVRDGELDDGRR